MSDDVQAARERSRQRRPEALALARILRASGERPIVRYLCPAGRGGEAGRGGCVMLSVYSTPHGPLWFRAALRQAPKLATERGAAIPETDVAELVADTVASAGGAMLSGLAVCRHYVASLTPERLRTDAQHHAGDFILRRDTPGAMFFRGPHTAR